jgi:hypothetical protein
MELYVHAVSREILSGSNPEMNKKGTIPSNSSYRRRITEAASRFSSNAA